MRISKKSRGFDSDNDYYADDYSDEYDECDDDFDECNDDDEYYSDYYDEYCDEDEYDPYDFDEADYEREDRSEFIYRNNKINKRRKYRQVSDGRDNDEEEVYYDDLSRKAQRSNFDCGLKRFFKRFIVFLMLLGCAFVFYKVYVRAPDSQVLGGLLNLKGDNNVSEDLGADKLPESKAPNRELGGVRKGVYTFLLVGKDVEGSHTDTVIVGMFDTSAHKLNFASIPRDTLINSEWNVKKINYVYPASINQGKNGSANLLEAISQLLGYPVGSYAILDITAAQKLVDTIGGVYFDVPCDMDWDAPDQAIPLHIHVKKGYQLLNGEQAVNVFRFRSSNDGSNSYPRGDIDRIEVQQNLLKAILSQTLSVKNIPNLSRLLKIAEENVETNLKASNMIFFAQEFLKLKAEDIRFMVMPGKPDGVIYGMSYVIPDIDGWLLMVNEYLNPFNRPILKENVDMLSYDGVDFTATQGKIKGGRESFMGSRRG